MLEASGINPTTGEPIEPAPTPIEEEGTDELNVLLNEAREAGRKEGETASNRTWFPLVAALEQALEQARGSGPQALGSSPAFRVQSLIPPSNDMDERFRSALVNEAVRAVTGHMMQSCPPGEEAGDFRRAVDACVNQIGRMLQESKVTRRYREDNEQNIMTVEFPRYRVSIAGARPNRLPPYVKHKEDPYDYQEPSKYFKSPKDDDKPKKDAAGMQAYREFERMLKRGGYEG